MPTPYSGGGGWPTFPLNLINDGEVYNFASIQKDATASAGLFGKLIDAVTYLKGVVAPSGSGSTNTVRSDGLIISSKATAGDSASGSAWIENDAASGFASARTKKNQAGDYFWLAIPGLVHGYTLSTVKLTTIGDSVNNTTPTTKANYRLVRVARDASASGFLCAQQDDSHTIGGGSNWATTVLTQTVTVTSNGVIDLDTYTYHLIVNSPVEAGTGSQMRIFGLLATQTITV